MGRVLISDFLSSPENLVEINTGVYCETFPASTWSGIRASLILRRQINVRMLKVLYINFIGN